MPTNLSRLIEKASAHRLSQWVRFACSFTGNVDDAQDVVQEAIRRTLAANPDLRREAQVNRYVLVAIRTSAFKLLESRSRLVPVDMEETAPADPDPAPNALEHLIESEGAAARSDLVRRALQCVDELPAEQARVIKAVLLDRPPLKLRQVAEQEDIAVSTVHYRLKTGLRAIAAILREAGDFS